MKDPINLLPAPIKKSRLQRLFIGRVQHAVNVLMVVLGAAVVFLLLVWGGLTWLQKRVQAESIVGKDRIHDSSQAVLTTNAFLAGFHEQVTHTTVWTDKMTDLLTILPDGLHLSLVTVTSTTKPVVATTLTAEGVTTDPTLVVAWRKKIEQLPWVGSVVAPLDNFATNQHGTFKVSIVVVSPSPTP